MQGDDPHYYRAIATPKHYDVHSGPEPTRHFADVDVSRHDQFDTYEPVFRAAVVEGKAGSVMCLITPSTVNPRAPINSSSRTNCAGIEVSGIRCVRLQRD